MRGRRGITGAVIALALGGSAHTGAAAVAWIANNGDATVSRIDLDTHEATTIAVGTFPWAVAASPDGQRAYVANSGDDTVSVIDAAAGAVIGTIPVGAMPQGIAVTPDGAKVYVALDGGLVAVIDAATQSVGPSISLVSPFGYATLFTVAMRPDGARVYVAKQENLIGSVAVIDTATDQFVADVFVTSEGFQMAGVAVSADGSRLWASSLGAGKVFEIDAATNLLLRDVPLDCIPGCGSGHALVPQPDGSRVYVALADFDRIAVIDTVAGAEVSSIVFPGAPTGVDVTPDGTRLYVPSNGITARIDIVDTTSETIVGTLLAVGEFPVGFGRFIVGDPVVEVPPPPVLAAPERSCQDTIAASWKRFAAKIHGSFASCFKRLLADVAKGAGTTAAAAVCDRSLDPTDPTSRLSRQRAIARAKVLSSCDGATPAALAHPCAGGATTMAEVADCVLDAQTRSVTETLAAEYGAPCSLATAVGLAAAFPALCDATP